jgi:hypothetical protein
MSLIPDRLVAFLLAFLLLANAAGASALDVHASSCCAGSAAATPVAEPPCHAQADSAALACDDGGRLVADDASACGDRCSHCAGHHASSPAGLLTAAASDLVVPASFQHAPAPRATIPAGHRDRLERPPSPVSLN